MAAPAPRPPIGIIVAILVSLPLFPYDWHKFLHILGAVLFLGNLIVTAGWLAWAVQRKDSTVVAFATSAVNRADQWFTSPGVILILLNGFAMIALRWGGWLGFTTTGWIGAGLGLLIATAVLYGAVIRRYQNQIARVSADAAQAGGPLPDSFFDAYRKWTLAGIAGTLLPVLALYFMVFKPG